MRIVGFIGLACVAGGIVLVATGSERPGVIALVVGVLIETAVKRHLARAIWRTLRTASSERMNSISPNLQKIEMPTSALVLT